MSDTFIVITGASSGIGFELLKICLDKEINVIAAVRDIEAFSSSESLTSLNRSLLFPIELDLESPRSVQTFSSRIKDITSSVESLILNAGYIKTNASLMTSLEELETHMTINFYSHISICQSIVRTFFLKKKSGSIVGVSSSAAIDSNPGRMAYASSKSAFSTALRVMSNELGKAGIRINIVAPGLTDTKLMRDSTHPDQIQMVIENTSLRNIGTPKDVANLLYFLSSAESSHITGQVISIDGGIR